MRSAVHELVRLGPLPDSQEAVQNPERVARFQGYLSQIEPPVTSVEAEALAGLFGIDDCFGLAWSLLHLIESADVEVVGAAGNPWVQLLEERRRNGREPSIE